MFDYQTMKLMHRHGDDEWVAMTEEGHGSQARVDPERSLLRMRIFRCTRCEDFIGVTSDAGAGEGSGSDAAKTGAG